MSDASDDLPLVSIVVPAHNVSPYIDACLWAIRRQTYPALEVVVVDDGSTDDSASIAERHAADDPRILVIRSAQNRGAAAARNTALQTVTGTFVVFADADDLMDPHLLEICVEATTRLSADVLQFTHVVIPHDAITLQCHHASPADQRITDVTGEAFFRLPVLLCTTFIRASLLDGVKDIFLERQPYSDKHFHWWLGLASSSSHYLPEPLFGYRVRPDSLSSHRDDSLIELVESFVDVAHLLDSHGLLRTYAPILQQKSLGAAWVVLTTIDRRFVRKAATAAQRLNATSIAPHSPGRPEGARANLVRMVLPLGSTCTTVAFLLLRPAERALVTLGRARRRRIARAGR